MELSRLAAASKEVAAAFEVARQTIEDDADVEIQGLRFKLAGSLRAEQEMTAELIVENNRLKRKQKSFHETSGKQVRVRGRAPRAHCGRPSCPRACAHPLPPRCVSPRFPHHSLCIPPSARALQ